MTDKPPMVWGELREEIGFTQSAPDPIQVHPFSMCEHQYHEGPHVHTCSKHGTHKFRHRCSCQRKWRTKRSTWPIKEA